MKSISTSVIVLISSVSGASAANIYAGSEYVLTSSTTWDGAQAEAIGLGGHLVAINSAAEEAALIGFFGGLEDLWIGLNDMDTEGTFVWTNGDPVTHMNWNSGEPNNLGGEDAVVMNWSRPGGWNDWNRGNTARGIVELSVAPSEASAIPEPSGVPVLFALGAALMGFRQRR